MRIVELSTFIIRIKCVRSNPSSSSSGQNTFLANSFGQVVTKTDQNGTVHFYSYDQFGRLIRDGISTVGSGVDGTIRLIATTYNSLGLVDTVTSYTAGLLVPENIVNQGVRSTNHIFNS